LYLFLYSICLCLLSFVFELFQLILLFIKFYISCQEKIL